MNRQKSKFAAVICAAGSSARMGGVKKEYCPLPGGKEGLTVLGAAVSAFAAAPEIGAIAVAVPPGGEAAARNALPPGLLPAVRFVSGGATRQASVFNALSLLADEAPDFVLIHDGARPWVGAPLIARVIAEVQQLRAVIPLLPLTETPKETDAVLGEDAVFIKRHLKRAFVGAAQTPQGFAFPEILAAHQKAEANSKNQPGFLNLPFTDDAEIWAAFCGPVAAVPGDPENRKITFKEDLA